MPGVLDYNITSKISSYSILSETMLGPATIVQFDAQCYATSNRQRREAMRRGEILLTVIHP